MVCISFALLRNTSYIDHFVVASLKEKGVKVTVDQDDREPTWWELILWGDTRFQEDVSILVNSATLGPKDLSSIRHFPRVKSLAFVKAENACDILASLKHPERLQSLSFRQSPVTTKSVSAIPNLSGLSELNLDAANCDKDAVSSLLGKCNNLVGLRTYGPDIDDRTVSGIVTCKKLRAVSFYETSVTDITLLKLQHLEELREIRLHRIKVSKQFASTTKQMKYLNHLRAFHCEFEPEALRTLVFKGFAPIELEIIRTSVSSEELQDVKDRHPGIILGYLPK